MTKLSLAAVATVLAVPAQAAADPSLIANPGSGKPGADVTLTGRDWIVGSGCPNQVSLYFRQGDRSLKLGTALHGAGDFAFRTHYQGFAVPGPAQFVGRQVCTTGVYRRVANVTVLGPGGDTAVRYVGRSSAGRVSFKVVDGNEVRNFRFVNRCAPASVYGSRVPGGMPIGDVSFSRRGRQFTIFGRFRAGGVVRGRARNRTDGCDSGRLSWRASRVD